LRVENRLFNRHFKFSKNAEIVRAARAPSLEMVTTSALTYILSMIGDGRWKVCDGAHRVFVMKISWRLSKAGKPK